MKPRSGPSWWHWSWALPTGISTRRLVPAAVVDCLAPNVLRLSRSSGRARQLVLIGAAAIFFAGLVLSLKAQPDVLTTLHLTPVVLLVALAVPLNVALNAHEFTLSARLIGRQVSFRTAVDIAILGTAANLLPLPGSAMVRLFALKTAGASVRESTVATLYTTLLWFAVSFVYAGAWVWFFASTLVGVCAVASGVGILVSAIVLVARTGGNRRYASAQVLNKCALVVLDAARLYLCFWAIGMAVSFAETSVLTASGALTSIGSFVPGGLGLREAMAAGIAPLIGLTASVAFLAAALNRILGLCVICPVAMLLGLTARRRPA